MVRIRLAKVGKPKKKKYHFRIVAIDSKKPRDGRYLEELGYYDPSKELLSLKKERIDYWMSKGAVPSDTVKRLIERLITETKELTENRHEST